MNGRSDGAAAEGRTPKMASFQTLAPRFAANLRRLREAAGLSQEELAFRAGIHRTQISLLEGGHRLPRVFTLVCVAGALEVTPDDLLDGITWEPIVAISGGLFVTPPEGEGDG